MDISYRKKGFLDGKPAMYIQGKESGLNSKISLIQGVNNQYSIGTCTEFPKKDARFLKLKKILIYSAINNRNIDFKYFSNQALLMGNPVYAHILTYMTTADRTSIIGHLIPNVPKLIPMTKV